MNINKLTVVGTTGTCMLETLQEGGHVASLPVLDKIAKTWKQQLRATYVVDLEIEIITKYANK